jgi:glutamine amidotransferase-like uncharacterized protein
MIYLYNGSGAAQGCVDATEKSLVRITQTPKQNIVKCDLSGRLINVQMIVIPGGNANTMRYGHFNANTKETVISAIERGARGVFMCAGALLMTDGVGDSRNPRPSPFPYVEGRLTGVQLNLPAYDVRYSLGENPGRVAQVVGNSNPFSAYWNLGPSFPRTEHDVVCRYNDIPGKHAACIESTLGRGKAVWSGVHPEFSRITGLFDTELQPHWDAQDALLRRYYGVKDTA